MRWKRTVLGAAAAGACFAAGMFAGAQTAPPLAPASAATTVSIPSSAAATAGGRLHGLVKSGNIPLPGVTVTAQNTLTGKRYSTTTDITGAWSLTIPQNGRYVIRTQFAAFAQGSQEALLNDTGRDRTVNFQLILASRAVEQEQQGQTGAGQNVDANAVEQAIRQIAGNGVENLSLVSALSGDTETGAGATGASGAELPSIAGNSDFGGDSVNINGQSGQVSPLAGLDVDRIRDAIETARAQGGNGQLVIDGVPVGGGGLFATSGGLFGGGQGGFMGGGMMGGQGGFGGGFGGRGGGGGGGGGRGNFRNFNPAQPHGMVYWRGTNSAVNAEPFSLTGVPQVQPANGSNQFGLTFMSEPYIPRLTKPSGKDTLFFTVAGQRSSSPDNFYATVPTLLERQGNFAGEATVYEPGTTTPYPNQSQIPVSSQATALLTCSTLGCQPFLPLPNLAAPVNGYNYQLLTTGQTNTTQAGVRYMRSIGPNAGMGGFGGFGRRGGGRSQNQGLRQSVNLNYNYSDSASDNVNMFPQLGGKTASDSNSLQAGYTVGYHRVTSISNVGWNRSNSNTVNFFTNTSQNVASLAGIYLPGDVNVPLNYGLPSISISGYDGLSETQPSFSINQTISASEVLSWIHGKHNMRFGGDYRRVHHDFLAGSNATGDFTFTGLFTQSPLADFLVGLPQSTTLNSSLAKSYLRDNAMDAYATDDWRVRSNLTLNYGVRYEFYAPYFEKYGHLAMVDTNPDAGFTEQAQVNAGGIGPASGEQLPGSLVFPWHKAFAPRVGLALRVPKVNQMVVRAGFGMNYSVGEYATFANLMAHQPPFTNLQTNQEAIGNTPSTSCLQSATGCFTLANGFLTPATVGNYAVDPHYGMPYVQTWNLDVQKTLPWGIVMNVGYNGSKANHLDVKSAPRALPNSPLTNPTALVFNYDQAEAFYKMSAGTVRVNKRMTKGVSMGANYQFAHAIDDASAVNGSAGTVMQNWQDLAAEEANSPIVPRQSVSGNYVYELPFGEGKTWATSGVPNHILEGFSVSGTFTFASGGWLTPAYAPNRTSVACGTSGSFRLNQYPGTSVTAGGGSLKQWFNTGAFYVPSATPGYCDAFGDAPRNSIEGPGQVENNMALSKTMQLGETRSMEIRATMNNVFNTVQYSGVNTTYGTPNFGQVTSVGQMRAFQFMARFRF